MSPAPVGTLVRIIANHHHHHYRIGGIYRVHQDDGDGTFKAIDEAGVTGDYLRWEECQRVGLGWEWIRGQLDARSLDLLGAFEGLENLTLRQDVETRLILGIPNLADRILHHLPEVEQAAAALQTDARDGDDELDIHDLFA
ncbi:MAG: hypothetical protein ACO3JG_16305 [Luteolibacter sp.]